MLRSENSKLEYKAAMTDSFLKTVSAFANADGGKVIFGVADDGTLLGIEEVNAFRIQLENKINDSVHPLPDYQLTTRVVDGKQLVELTVLAGDEPPYLYNGRAYQRKDTSSTPMDSTALRRLVLHKSVNRLPFDQTISRAKKLQFSELEAALQEKVGVEVLTHDILRTLGLMKGEQYTMAGELLADQNEFPASGLSLVRFGENINIFLERVDLAGCSLLHQYDGAMEMFRKWYHPYEIVQGSERKSFIQIPEEAFREAIANAIVHRRYDLNAIIRVAFFADRIEILSPGGLPEDLSPQTFLYGNGSVLRNLSIAEVFHRLGLIEKFGTGVRRIREAYAPYAVQAQFTLSEDQIRVILPVLPPATPNTQHTTLNSTGKKKNTLPEKVLTCLGTAGAMNRKALAEALGYSNSRVYQILQELLSERKIQAQRVGRQVLYSLH